MALVKLSKLSFHAGVAAYQIAVTKWLKDNMLLNFDASEDVTIKTMKKLSARFLTNWTFTLLTLYFMLCIFEDILLLLKGGESLKARLRKIKNYMFTVLVAPMTVFVTVVFWGVWFVDRELIFPKVIDKVLPLWLNHSLHTTTTIFVLAEMCLFPHNFSKLKTAMIGITAYLGVYLLCMIGTYVELGIWLYPIFKAEWPIKIALFLGLYVLAMLLYGCELLICTLRWKVMPIERQQRPKPTKKKTKKH